MTVHVEPLPIEYRGITRRLRPMPPPVFEGGPPTAADRALAAELFALLDEESRGWYLAAGLRFLAPE